MSATWRRSKALVPPGTYFVRVRAANTVGVSAPSNQVTVTVASAAACTTAPPAPASILAQSGGLLVALSWPASAGATSYLLDAGTASGATDVGTASVGNVTTYQGVGAAGSLLRARARRQCVRRERAVHRDGGHARAAARRPSCPRAWP